MRFVLCILLVALPSSFAFAAKGTMSLSEAQAAAAKGDAEAAAAITMPPGLFERMRQARPQ